MTNNFDNLSVDDFRKVCRTCLTLLGEEEKKNLYKNSENCSDKESLLQMLIAVTFVQFTDNDVLPNQICSNCEREIIRSYKFAQKCLEVDVKLKKCLKGDEIHRKTTIYPSKTLEPEYLEIDNHLKEFHNKTPNKSNSTASQNQENYLEDIEIKQEIDVEENTGETNFESIFIKPEVLLQYEDQSETEDNINVFEIISSESENSDSDDEISYTKQGKVLKTSMKPNTKLLGSSYKCKKCEHPLKSGIACRVCSKATGVHSSEQAFACDVCGKHFGVKANLTKHRLTHSSEETQIHTTEVGDSINLLPQKSSHRYWKEYQFFKNWCDQNDASTYNEFVLLAYFKFKSETHPSSLWSVFSMLKSTLNIKHNIDIKNYTQLIAFLKTSKVGYISKKSKTLDIEDIEKFICDASDTTYLLIKVAFIIGMSAACRKYELVNMRVQDVQDRGDLVIISIPDTKTNKPRISCITKPTWINLIRKYTSLRPQGVELTRFFLFYSENKCKRQHVGINSFGRMPSKVARFLELENPEEYTAHCFRRSSAVH